MAQGMAWDLEVRSICGRTVVDLQRFKRIKLTKTSKGYGTRLGLSASIPLQARLGLIEEHV